MNYWRLKNNRGFTLIELLVVIAIIGLLASIVLVSLNSARGKARDARRMADLHQLQLALEMYYDKYGGYMNDTFTGYETCDTTQNDIGKLVTEGFISVIPCDPLKAGGYHYHFDPGDYSPCSTGYCSNYCLFVNLEAGGSYGVIGGDYSGCPGI